MLSFIGGVHIKPDRTPLGAQPLTYTNASRVVIPMKMHVGAEAIRTVVPGERVLAGQLIGRCPDGKLGCDVHASISGTVTYSGRMQVNGRMTDAVTIESSVEDESIIPQPFEKTLHEASAQELIDRIRLAGITGLGGAGFPTWAKLSAASGHVTKFLVNCTGGDVLSCTDAYLIRERPHSAVNGIKVMMKILKVKHADIFIGEDMYREAYELLDFIKNRTLIDVRLMKSKYPQGDERQLLAAAYRIELPYDKLPLDSEAVVFNISTCVAVYDALLHGMPMTHKLITVSGDAVREPRIMKVPIGLSFADVLNACGGVAENSHIIDGGLMMGREADLKDAYVTKQTTAVCAVSSVTEYGGTQCVRCGRCENVCPMRLPVSRIYELSSVGDVRTCASLGVLQCVGCGCCSYVCVGALPLVRMMQEMKLKAYSLICKQKETEGK